MIKKQIAIISHDRHREDYVYLVDCEEKDEENYIKKIWQKDFNRLGDCPMKFKFCYTDGSGDYFVEVAILKTI